MHKRSLLTGRRWQAVFFLTVALAPFAFAQNDVSKQLLNDPNTAWTVYGPQSHKKVRDKSVQGGGAVEVSVAARGAHPWDTAAQVPISGKIAAGDHILAAAWLKATTASGAPADLNMRIQATTAPYDAVAEKQQDVGDGWKLYSLDTIAGHGCAPEACALVIHLGSARQTVALGPAFVLKLDDKP